MKNYARIENTIVVELVAIDDNQDITQLYHPSLTFVECDSTVMVGMIYDGKKFALPVLPSPTATELAQQQSTAIDGYIAEQIKTLGYDDIGQVAACCLAGQWQTQAQVVNTWIQLCWNIQANIVAGSMIYATVDDAINALPAVTAS